MPTLLALDTLDDTVSLCRDLGLCFIELNMNMPQYGLDVLSRVQLSEHQKNSPIHFTIHLEESLNVWDFNPLVSRAYLDTVLRVIALAAETGIPVLNMHMHDGVSFTLPDQRVYLFQQYRAAYMEKTLQFRGACESAIGNSGVRICIENSGGFTGFQQEAIDCLLQSPVFGLTLDVGHNHVAAAGDEAFILQRGSRLCHMHLHDALPGRDHLTLGTGEIDLPAMLALAQRHGCRCVLETKTVEALRASVKYLRLPAAENTPNAIPPA